MNEPDTARILGSDALTSADSYGSMTAGGPAEEPDAPGSCSARPPFKLPRSQVTVEPVMFLAMFSVAMQAPLSTQYLWDRISEELDYNSSRTSECSNLSLNQDPLQKEVETLTAQWSLYISLGGFSVGLLVVPHLGSWSDLAGRRPVLILSNLGLALQAVVYLVVMYLKLPVAYLLVGRIIGGLSGEFGAVLSVCFSYVADISDKRSRTFRVAILEACLGISGMLASIIGGQWQHAQGYIKPFWLILATCLAAALYVCLFVRETVLPNPSAKLFTFHHYKAVWHLVSTGGSTSDKEGRFHRSKLWLYLLSFFFVAMIHAGSSLLYVLYELSSPLCWGPTLIGYGAGALNIASLTSLLGLKILQSCLSDFWVALIGLVSSITGLLVFSVADTTELMFTGYALCFLYMTATPVLRSTMSKMVDRSEQGALFAAIACVESLCFLVAGSLFNTLYPATLHFMKGFTFLFAAVVLLIPSGILGYLQCVDQRRAHKDSGSPQPELRSECQ